MYWCVCILHVFVLYDEIYICVWKKGTIKHWSCIGSSFQQGTNLKKILYLDDNFFLENKPAKYLEKILLQN